MSNRCAGCGTDRLLALAAGRNLSGIGYVCGVCCEKLARPQVLEGVVNAESLAFIASHMEAEFARRKAALMASVREACQ